MQKKHRRLITLLLACVLIVSALTAGLTAGANGGTMDLDGDGAITIHDAQLAQEIRNEQRPASENQIFALADYSVQEVINKVFGKSYTPVTSGGVYQIKTLKDLYFVRDNATKTYSYKLANNIDLGGIDWTPIDDFAGTFDGNNKTISNVKITKGIVGSKNATVLDQGFFSEILAGATVKNLNLSNVEMELTQDKAQFAGLLVGTNRGTVTNCFTHGKITDQREEVTLSAGEGGFVRIAALIGRCVGAGAYSTVSREVEQPSYAYWKASETSVSKLYAAAQLAVDVADRKDIDICLCGQGEPTSGATQFQDISSTYGVSAVMQSKQDQVVSYMEEMGTLRWTAPTTLQWIKSAHEEVDGTVVVDSQSTWPTTETQYGLPFNGMHSGLERFQSVADYKNGVYTINPNKATEVQLGLITADAWYSSDPYDGEKDAEGNLLKNEDGQLVDAQGNLITDTGYDGWIRYIGNDCSSAVSWSWLQVSPVDAYVNSKGTVDGGGVYLDTCRHSFPYSELDKDNANHYDHQHGLVQIGNYSFNKLDEDGNIVTAFYDATKASSSLPMEDKNRNGVLDAGEDLDGDGKLDYGGDGLGGTTATTSANIWEWNADLTKPEDTYARYAKLYETYAQARKGDALQTWFTGVKDTTQPGSTSNRIWEGHMRLLAEDPIVIRNRDGSIDIEKSYFITHEHGGAVGSRKTAMSNNHIKVASNYNTNSWGLYLKYRFTDLDYVVGAKSGDGCRNANNSSRCYLPVTCRALRTETQVAQKYSYTSNPANSHNYVAVSTPYSGMIYTNYALSHVTVHIYDGSGKEIITQTICALPEAGARSTQTQSRYANHYHKQVDLTTQFAHLATDESFESGAEYTFNFDLVGVTNTYDAASGTWTENSSITTALKTFTYTLPAG